MREILFRGKNICTDEWVHGAYLPKSQAICIEQALPQSTIYCDYFVVPETVGQYTGLTDKNGKKIFEGDIVKLFLIDDVEIGVIAYDEEKSRLMFHDGHSHYGYDNTCQFEVIGNIYDNIELLM